MLLPRFTTSLSGEAPLVIDRQGGLAAEFALIPSAQSVAALLNARPSMVESFHWTIYEGDTP